MNYWLLKSEPGEFSIDDLRQRPRGTEPWSGVRNYQARNMLREQMQRGDQVFFYHSSCKQPGIVGIATVVREGYPDDSAFDPRDPHYDPGSDPQNPRWYMVDIKFVRKLKRTISLQELKQIPALAQMPLLRRGNRLSVMPVTREQWRQILQLE